MSRGFPRGFVGGVKGPAEVLCGPDWIWEAKLERSPPFPLTPHLSATPQLPAALGIHWINLQGRPSPHLGVHLA